MFNKILLPFLILLLLPIMANAQEILEVQEKEEAKIYYMHPSGKFVPKEVVEKYKKPHHNDNLNRNMFGDILLSPDDMEDTLGYKHLFSGANSRFGFEGQDRMVMWFEAPADMRIVSAGFMCTDNEDTVTAVGVKLVKFAWTMEEINNLPWSDGNVYLGYYEATGNGYNDATAYLDDPDRTGGWVDSSGLGLTSPFGNDLWSDAGVGFPFVPVAAVTPYDTPYNWVDFAILGEPEVLRFDIIGVSTKNLDPVMGGGTFIRWLANQNTGLGGTFKFYQSDNGNTTWLDFGWFGRDFIWDYLLAVVLTGDTPPDINSYTHLTGTISNDPRTVDANITDANPSGGAFGVDTAKIVYSIDGGVNWLEVVMTGTEPDYTGDIPGQPGGTEVTYKIEATDVEGNTSTSLTEDVYFVSEVVNGENLIVFNGYGEATGYPQDYFFGEDVQTGFTTFAYDVWAYGPLEAALVESYTNIFEFATPPIDYNDDVIRPWLAANGGRNYYLAGQEWLGERYSYNDTDFVAGFFEFDILGINHVYNDVSFNGDSGQAMPSLVMPLTGTTFGGPLLTLFNSLTPPADSMMYHPTFMINDDNWIDAYDVEGDVEVDMNVETRGIGGLPNVQILPTQSNRTLPAGNKIVYTAYDPLALTTAEDSSFAYVHWIGFDNANTPYQALLWFGVALGVERDDNLTPETFSLSQNYPNPFNPSTNIKFSIPEASDVVLKIYDVLGSEVAVIVNENLEAGNYTVDFDASKFASGMYIYSIKAGEFNASKKMMLLK